MIGEIDETLVATHAELDGRVKYLEGQAQDMERAIGDLEKVLEELARRIKSTFEENFARINKAFGKNFASLFAGGSAELTLLQLDEENYGIEISVQPPGVGNERQRYRHYLVARRHFRQSRCWRQY